MRLVLANPNDTDIIGFIDLVIKFSPRQRAGGDSGQEKLKAYL
jgi:hypothetical protein